MAKSFNFQLLTKEGLERIHDESLKILEKIGIKVPDKKILDIFKQKGANIDYNSEIIRIPQGLTKELLNRAINNTKKHKPEHEEKSKININGWMSMGNLGYIIDPGTNERRDAKLEDMLKAIVVGNELQYIERISPLCNCAEYGSDTDIINQYLLCVFSKKRYFISMVNSINTARAIIEMSMTCARDDINLRDGSLAEFELEPVANLEFASQNLEIAREFAKHKMKIMAGHWCWMGFHTPLSYESAILLSNVNVIATACIIMAINPEMLFLDYFFIPHTMNKNNTNLPLFGSPNQAIFALAAKQLADFYGFKFCYTNAALSDEVGYNFQSGFERGVTLMTAAASGVDSIGVKGIIGPDQGVSLEQLIIDNEFLSFLNFLFSRNIKVNKDRLNIDLIYEKGIGGEFIDYFKDEKKLKECYWDSDIFSADSFERTEKDQVFKNLEKKLEKILTGKFPPRPVISNNTLKTLDGILDKYIKDRKVLDLFKKDLNNINHKS